MSTPPQPIVPPSVFAPIIKKRRPNSLLRFFGFCFAFGSMVFLIGAAVGGIVLLHTARELPDFEVLAKYEPPVMTRVHANDGRLIAEYAIERRIYVPVNTIPKMVINAYLSAEDKNFFEHKGLDYVGIARAVLIKAQGGRLTGASTITQQVAKNFLLTSERTFDRKLKEAILAMRIERAYSKEKILELYLNEIYLGLRSYGIAAAALNYYGKELEDLTVGEAAYLAALPKAPENYHPFRKTERAITRRNFVLRRMLANGFITRAVFEREKALPLNVNPRPFNSQLFAGEYFAEEVRRTLVEMFGEDKTVGGGLSVRTTMVPSLQRMAKKALVDGLVRFDRRKGWRGPVSSIDMNGDWHRALHNIVLAGELEPWRLAVVTKVDNKQGLLVALRSTSGRVESSVKLGEPELVRVPVSTTRWTKRGRVSRWLKPGDVIYVAPNVKKDGTVIADQWRLMQKPAVDGGIVAMDPHTGRVLALVGGFTFGLWKGGDQFNRATTANRQPGSAFKPLVYAAAIDNGYTPATLVNDAPIVIDQGPGKEPWKPSNYGKNFAGPSTLRTGIVRSKNLMTVRLARDVGMPLITEYARRFDVYDNLPPFLSMSLGAGETKLIRMTTAYAMLANGGRQVEASLIDRIQDRYGRTVWRHDQKACSVCEPQAWAGQEEPELDDKRLQIIDPHTLQAFWSCRQTVRPYRSWMRSI
ncbi:MAG: transglycosylase domain-containing protein, partial [Pseudomonadota bacterium]